MHYKNKFILDRDHFSECYDQSQYLKEIRTEKKAQPRYLFIAALVIIGFAILTFLEKDNMLGVFFLVLAILEFFSFQYKKSWWLTRQMWSKNANNTITLYMDENELKFTSLYVNNRIAWDEILNVTESPLGYTLQIKKGGISYLSKSSLLPEMDALIHEKCVIVNSEAQR
jgi:hypothetical protein